MTIQTRPCFFYDFEVNELNYAIDLNEGTTDLEVNIRQGFYSFNNLAIELRRALNSSGNVFSYEVTTDRSKRLLTITEINSNPFSLKFASGARNGVSAANVISFPKVDISGAFSYVGSVPTGKVFEPQFLLQSYVDNENFQQSISATRNESASGVIEICRFGTRSFIEFNIKYQNNSAKKELGPIESNSTGKDELVDFMKWVTQIGGVEIMKDRNIKDNFISLVIEKTPSSQSGTGFKLRELYGQGLPGFFETGILRFRVTDVVAC